MTQQIRSSALVGLLLAAIVLDGCAGQAELAQRVDSADKQLRAEQEALRKELASLHLRQQLLADRLRQTEDELVRLRAQLVSTGERSGDLNRRSQSATAAQSATPAQASTPVTSPTTATAPFDAAAVYAGARIHYGERHYDEAIAAFARIVSEAPGSPEADNAQYWIGECHYGAGRFQAALEAFNQVFDYAETEKDDDAQLKIARCHLSLGQKEQAIAAFRHLLASYPDSEYVEAARRELRYLGDL